MDYFRFTGMYILRGKRGQTPFGGLFEARAGPTPAATSSAAVKKGFNLSDILEVPSGCNLSLVGNLRECAPGVNWFFGKGRNHWISWKRLVFYRGRSVIHLENKGGNKRAGRVAQRKREEGGRREEEGRGGLRGQG